MFESLIIVAGKIAGGGSGEKTDTAAPEPGITVPQNEAQLERAMSMLFSPRK